MSDAVLNNFLRAQQEAATGLNRGPILSVQAVLTGESLPQHYLLDFRCRGLVKGAGGVVEADHFVVGVHFGANYLRNPQTFETLAMLEPPAVFHPNIKPPFICVGAAFLRPGTGLVELAYRVHQMLTYAKWSPHDALNREAAQWARNHADRFPIDQRPLFGRRLEVEVIEAKRS